MRLSQHHVTLGSGKHEVNLYSTAMTVTEGEQWQGGKRCPFHQTFFSFQRDNKSEKAREQWPMQWVRYKYKLGLARLVFRHEY